jgi:DnaJ-domain-containing protein 1
LKACLTLGVVAAAPAAAQDTAPDTRPPTTIEQALAEHVCGAQPSSSTGDVHEPCIHAQRRALRAEFGYDLGRLSDDERGELDVRCSRLRTPERVEPYLNCLTAWLVALREARPHDPAASRDAEVFGVVSAATNPAPRAQEPRRGTSVIVWVMIGIVAGAGAAFGGFHLKKQLSRVEPTCQRCGAALKAAGSLCAPCRHEMGLAAKQAIADRAAEKQAEDTRRRTEQQQSEERQRLADAQAAQEQQRLDETKSRLGREARERPQAEARPPESGPVGADPYEIAEIVETDPFKILGVAREATPEEINAAYRERAEKYDEARVAHFGDGVRAHYKAKAEAVEQAYRTLTS